VDAPFFIVGSGRSGSTLLRLIVSTHSRISIPPETWFLIPLVDRLPLGDPLGPAQVTEAHQIITSHYRWPDLALDAGWLRERYAELDEPTLRQLTDVIYLELTRREGKIRWGDKTPPYVKILPQLTQLYPEARIIHLARDGRDVAKSFLDAGWHGRFLHRSTAEWNVAIDAFREYRRSGHGDDVLDIRYEDLVLDTEATVRRVCRFLGESYEPAMLDFADSIEAKVPEREAHAHKKLFRAPRASDIERWRRELSRFDLLIAESFLARNLRRMGYPLQMPRLSWSFPLVRVACRLLTPPLEFLLRALSFAARRLGRERTV
jgi:hypothetical protein